MSEIELEKCKYCHKKPEVRKYSGGLYYIQCGCTKWDPNQFLGLTANNAIKQWNLYNSKVLTTELKELKTMLDH